MNNLTLKSGKTGRNQNLNGHYSWDMMNSLRNNHELRGKSKTEIIELLGIPETKNESEFGYYLGMSTKHGIDTGHLTIKFDKNGKVIEFNVRHS